MQRFTLQEDAALYPPNPGGQAAFLDDYDHRYVAFAAGWGAGKTWAGARKLVNLHLRNAFDERGRPTYVKGLMIAPTYQLAATVNIPELRRAMDEANLKYRFLSDPKRYCFILPDLGTEANPSEILVRTAEAPERLAGFEVGHLWGDEAGQWHQNDADLMADAMLQGEGRLRSPKAQYLQANYTFTHEGDCTRVYHRFEEQCIDRPDYALYRAGTSQNPLMCDFVREKRRDLSPELAAQYLDGRAMSLRGGAVYSSFDESRNIDENLKLCTDLPLHLSLDFNIDPGMHAILGQHLPHEDMLIATHEIHEPRMDVRKMIHAVRKLIETGLGGWRFPILTIFGDASGSGKWAGTGDSCWDMVQECLRNTGIQFQLKVPRANPPVADRVNAFNCILHTFDGRVRYKVNPRCNLLIRDLKQMRWTHGEVDKTDRHLSHAADAEGYRVHWLMPVRPIRISPRSGTVGFSR